MYQFRQLRRLASFISSLTTASTASICLAMASSSRPLAAALPPRRLDDVVTIVSRMPPRMPPFTHATTTPSRAGALEVSQSNAGATQVLEQQYTVMVFRRWGSVPNRARRRAGCASASSDPILDMRPAHYERIVDLGKLSHHPVTPVGHSGVPARRRRLSVATSAHP